MSRPVVIAALELIVILAVVALILQRNDGGSAQPTLGFLRFERDGREVTLVSSVQAGGANLLALELDWGDGQSEQLPAERAAVQQVRAQHAYADDGSYEVQLRATFDDGSASVRRGSVVIAPASVATVLPTASPAAPAGPSPTQSPEASPLAGADPDEPPEVEPTAEPTQAPTPEPTAAPAPVATPPPAATPAPQPTPPPGNQPPEVVIVALAAQPALAVMLTAVATDPEGALIAVAVDWGDGQSDEVAAPGSSLTRSHSYAAPGAYTVTVVALDGGGRESNASATVTAAE